MAKERMINTRIWSDSWVSKLDPIEKLLFFYFLTNTYTNISGIYELPLKIAAVETGVDPSMLEKMLPHLEPKVIYKHGWVILPNFPKYQNTQNPKIMAGIQRELSSIPKEIHTLSIAYGYPIALIPILIPIPNSIGGDKSPLKIYDIVDENEKKPDTRRVKDKEAVYHLFSAKKQPWWAHVQEREAALRLFDLKGLEQIEKALAVVHENRDDKFCPVVTRPFKLEQKWDELLAFKQRHG